MGTVLQFSSTENDIAIGPIFGRGDRTIDKSEFDLRVTRRECGPDHVGDAEGLAHDTEKFREDRAFGAGLVMMLVTDLAHRQDTDRGHAVELPLDRVHAHAGESQYLIDEERFVRMTIEQPQHFLLGGREQGISQAASRLTLIIPNLCIVVHKL